MFLLLSNQNKLKFLSLLFLILVSNISIAQQTLPTYKILGVSVEGNVTADPSVIIAASGLKIDDEIQIPGDATINAIKRILALNIFSDVQLIKERQVGNGIYVLIKVKEYPRLEDFVFVGNDEIGEKDLKKEVTLIKGQTLKPQDISKLKRNILRLYEEKGMLNAEITTSLLEFSYLDTIKKKIQIHWVNKDDSEDTYISEIDLSDRPAVESIERMKSRVLLKIKIDEGTVILVKQINFYGNKNFTKGKLLDQFDEIVEKRWWRFWKKEKFDKKNFEKDKEALIKFYKKNGYKDATILKDSVYLDENKKNLFIDLYLYEGPQYKIRNIQWIGNTVFPTEVLNKRLGFEKGDIYDYEKFERNLRQNEQQTDVSSLYFDNGYLGFSLKTEEVKVAEDSLDIIIKIAERNQFKIGYVEIKGNDKTMDKVIRRELFTRPGDYFNRGLLLRSLQQLANLQYFNPEKLYQEGIDYFPTSDSTVDITYKVEEKSSDYLNASVGYSGSWGFSGAVGITLTNFSLSNPFTLGGGQVLNFNWQFGIGNYYRTFQLGFTEPWFMDTPTSIGFDVFDTRQIYIYELRQYGGSIRAGRRLSWPDDYFTINGSLRFYMNDVKGGGGYYREGMYKQYSLTFGIGRRDIDNPIFPSTGSILNLDFDLSGGPFLPGDVDYLKSEINLEIYRRLFGTNKVSLFLGNYYGFIYELVPNTPIQPFEYYYMGGSGLIIAT
ncbi:MAG: outer membrane protein assembly factor, partial [Ignavibacteria bacterium]